MFQASAASGDHDAFCSCRTLSRRSFLHGAVTTAAAAGMPAGAFAQTRGAGERVDMHHHFYTAGMKKYGGLGGPLTDNWTAQTSLDEMDKNGVRASILSVASTPMAWYRLDTETLRGFVREINDFAAKMVADHPGRYGLFAFLSMVDVDGSLKEIEYAFDTLKADGIGIATGWLNKYPGDPKFAPILEELNRRKATLYFHPTTQTCCEGIVPGVGDSWAEVPQDTTRAALSLMYSGSLLKLRDIKFLWSHGGGTIPMIAERIDWLSKMQVKNRDQLLPDGPLGEFRRFYYDTANAGYPGSMAALMKLVDPSHIVFGTDYPYVTTEWNMKALVRAGLNEDQIRAIEGKNFEALAPRLAKA